MNQLFARIGSMLFRCGLTREEYEQIQPDMRRDNYRIWKYASLFITAGFVITSVLSLFLHEITASTVILIGMAVYCAVTAVLFWFSYREDSRKAPFHIYLTMALLLLSSMLINLLQPNIQSIGFVIILVMLPVSTFGNPCSLALLQIAALLCYLCVGTQIAPEKLETSRMNVISCVVLGFFLDLFYSRIRGYDAVLRLQEEQLARDQRSADQQTRKLTATLQKMSESAVDLLGDVVESRNLESGEHVRRVKGFTYILANQVMEDLPEYGLDQYTVDLITFTSALHDVGKISIPDAILCKPGRLTAEEFEIMKTHCEKGADIINKMADRWSQDYLDMGLSICLNHHEKWDGKGYPKGLKGDEIPIAAQIVSIADIYDALTTKRVYKDPYPPEAAFDMILNGQCGAFSEKLLGCFVKCRTRFQNYRAQPDSMRLPERDYELVSMAHPDESFVIGLHDQNRTLREKVRLREEVSVLESLSESFLYVCYVNMPTNEVVRFKASDQFARILDSYGDELKPNEKFDRLLNSIIVAEDYQSFREDTERYHALDILQEQGHLVTDFRIRLEDGVHYCRMKITQDPNNALAVIIGIAMRDEEHSREMEYLSMQQELETARREIENQEKLADRLAVIDCISSEYDYVCSLNADTMEVVVYRAEDWIRDMFKNLEDIVVSPEVRNETLRGIVHPDDFDRFQEGSRHENVLKGLGKNGNYCVDYRAYKYGKLVNYQTRYALDRNNPKRIIIGLHSLHEDEIA